jgi:tetratricopeptide (TPR) repeat protein
MPRLRPICLAVLSALCLAACATPADKQAERSSAVPPVAGPGESAAAMYRLGQRFESEGRAERAIAAYREALRRDPLLVDAYTALGMVLAGQGRYGDAIRQFQAAVVLAPKSASAHNNLGYAYLLDGAHQQAIRSLEEATRLDPQHAKSQENLRTAQAKLAAARPAPTPLASATPPAAAETSALALVEVAPGIFELKVRTPQREIEARPLPPLPSKQSQSRSYTLEVSNGNGVSGLARRVAGWLAGAGIATARLTNQRPFVQRLTEVQYRDGYAAEAARLAGKLEHPARLVPSRSLADGVDLRLVLGKDLLPQTALRSLWRSRA